MVIRSENCEIEKEVIGSGQHRFRQGDIVMLSRGDPLSEKPIEAIVSDRRRDSIRIVINEAPSDLRKDSWRMDRGANRVAYDRMRDSLNSIFQEEGGVPLRDLLLGSVHDPSGTALYSTTWQLQR